MMKGTASIVVPVVTALAPIARMASMNMEAETTSVYIADHHLRVLAPEARMASMKGK